jgi:circadian clock protein KaiC
MSKPGRVTSGIPNLDRLLGGGFIDESAILVRGAPGTGKTTLGLQFLLEGIRQGEPGLFISFEEFPQSLYRDALSVGWNLPDFEREGGLQMLFTSPQVLLQSLATPDSNLITALHQHCTRRIVLDSLTHFTQSIPDGHDLRHAYHQVISAFRREGVTAMYLGEDMRSDYTNREKGRVSFIVDCLVLLRYLEIDSAIQRALLVLKMRSSAHSTTIHNYTIGQGGLTVGQPIEGKSGLLSGLVKSTIISNVQ